MEINRAVVELLKIVDSLCIAHPQKKFTLDGRLVGDIGEILVEKNYELNLYEGLRKHYDARTPCGRDIQIKATMKNSLTFPADHVPEYYIGVKIHSNGEMTEIFNGPGKVIWDLIQHRARPKNNLHSISIAKLENLNLHVSPEERVKKRVNKRSL